MRFVQYLNEICAYPEAVNGEQMMLAMERPATYNVCGHRQTRKYAFA